MFAMAGRHIITGLLLAAALFSCSAEKPAPPATKAQPTVVVKPRRPVLTPEQRTELRFPADIITKVEQAAGSEAEPFFITVSVPSENLKGEKEFEREKLAGFSVRTNKTAELIASFRAGLRVRGYLIFRSRKSYGTLPDFATVVKGNNSYDILKIQGTEAASYQLDTKAIIVWLKARQKQGAFVITGAGADWLEARFIKPPANMLPFARNICAFAPDVLEHGPGTVQKLAERMKKTNEFSLVWD